MAYLHEQWFWQCRMRQPHPTPYKNRIIPIFGCGCRIRHCQNHCSCKQTLTCTKRLIIKEIQEANVIKGPEWVFTKRNFKNGKTWWQDIFSQAPTLILGTKLLTSRLRPICKGRTFSCDTIRTNPNWVSYDFVRQHAACAEGFCFV
jgi:hypothetical protein